MTIRPAVAEDVPHVLPMVGRLAQLHESWDPQRYPYIPGIAERYDRWLRSRAEDSRSVFLVAEVSGRVVGFVVATVEKNIPIYRTAEFGFVHDLWMDEAYRHEGVARQMVMLLIERFNGMGIPQIRLETATGNEAARKLFESCGFRTSTMEMMLQIHDA